MRIGVGMPTNGDPTFGVNNVVALLTEDYWLANQPDGRQSERTATDWTWDSSHTTLRLTLRNNIFFHDNTHLDAEVAAASLREGVAKGRTLSFKDVTAVNASGPSTVDIHLARPNAFLLSDLAIVAVTKPGKTPSTTGPFQLVTRSGQDAVLRAYPRYYRGPPSLSEIDIKTYPTQRNAWAALMRGDIDMLHEVSRDAAEFVKAESTVKSYSFERPYYIPLVFNVRHPVLRKATVRQALNEALDRAALVRGGLNGWGRPADGPIRPEYWAYSRGTPFVFNPDAARSLLDAAGYPLRPADRNAIPSRFSFQCLVYTGDSRFERLAVLVQKQLADVGVDMQLVPIKDVADLVTRFSTGNFDAFIFEMAGGSLSWVYQFWHSGNASLNDGYQSADTALDQLKGSRSDDEIRTAIADLTRVMHDDPPAAFLAWQTTMRAVSTKFDVEPELDRDIFSNAWQWRLAAPNQ